jgi:hypothetical protein
MFGLPDPFRTIADSQSGINQGDMRIALWKVAKQSFRREIHILTEKAHMIAVLQNAFEHLDGLFLTPNQVQAFNHPEGTDRKGRVRHSEVIRSFVTVH